MTEPLIYKNLRLAAIAGGQEEIDATNQLIANHQAANASTGVLEKIFAHTGSQNIGSLQTLEVRIKNNRGKEYKDLGKSLSDQHLTQWAAYLRNAKGKELPIGIIAARSLYNANILGHLDEFGALFAYKDFDKAKAVVEETSIDHIISSGEPLIEKKNRLLERKEKSYHSLEDALIERNQELAKGFAVFMENYRFEKTHLQDLRTLYAQKGGIITQVKGMHVSEEVQEAIDELSEQDVILPRERRQQNLRLILETWITAKAYDKELIVGDLVDDLRYISSLDSSKLLGDQNQGHLIDIVDILDQKGSTCTPAEREFIIHQFNPYEHRIGANNDDENRLGEAYVADYKAGFSFSKGIIRKDDKWQIESPTAIPMRSLFKDMPFLAGYSAQASREQLVAIINHQESHYFNGDNEEKVVKNKSINEHKAEKDAVVVLARKNAAIQAKISSPLDEKNKEGLDKAKNALAYLRGAHRPAERFAEIYGITLDDFILRAQDKEATYWNKEIQGSWLKKKDEINQASQTGIWDPEAFSDLGKYITTLRDEYIPFTPQLKAETEVYQTLRKKAALVGVRCKETSGVSFQMDYVKKELEEIVSHNSEISANISDSYAALETVTHNTLTSYENLLVSPVMFAEGELYQNNNVLVEGYQTEDKEETEKQSKILNKILPGVSWNGKRNTLEGSLNKVGIARLLPIVDSYNAKAEHPITLTIR